jgi:hypothetical protein
MAKRGQFAGDPEGARQYLANLVASDQWKAAKPLGDYQDGQIIRKANAFRQQEQAGLPLDNKAARGHADIIPVRPEPVQPSGQRRPQIGQADRDRRATPTPPSLPAGGAIVGGHAQPIPTPAPAPRTRKDEKIFHAPKVPMDTRINGPRGSYQMNTTRFKDVIRELKAIEKSKGPNAKVYFSLWDNRKGDWKKLYVQKGVKSANNGVSVGDLLARIRDAKKSGVSHTDRGALIDSWEEDIDGGDAGGGSSDGDDELPAVFTTIGVHLMGA